MITIRELERHEVPDVWTLDRSEVIDAVYYLREGRLILEAEHYDLSGWPAGEPEQSMPLLVDCFDRGGTFYGAFEGDDLVGAAILDSKFMGREHDQLQLKFLHVSHAYRNRGLGRTLFEKSVARARELGARRLYISATPSENTIRFYLGLGCVVTDEVDPDLYELEPEDIHLEYAIA
ncbi:MAG: GNAT family N-acetyltransferase [Anaerolineae bacterium]|jgi:GNAT superfamily N-acetyltransferase